MMGLESAVCGSVCTYVITCTLSAPTVSHYVPVVRASPPGEIATTFPGRVSQRKLLLVVAGGP